LLGYVVPLWQNATVTAYDILVHLVIVKAPGQTDANSQRFSYTLDGTRQKTTTTDPKGHATESWKDIWGRTVKVKPQIGPSLEYEYRCNGKSIGKNQKQGQTRSG
jgi:hypothetical protein